MIDITKILDFKNKDIENKIKARISQKTLQVLNFKNKKKLDEWALQLYEMGISADYKSYKACTISVEIFEKLLRYIYSTKKNKKIFFISSKGEKSKKDILESFKYCYSFTSRRKYINDDIFLKVGFDDFISLKRKIKNSNNFKNESYIDIVNGILSNDIYFVYVSNSYNETNQSRLLFHSLIDIFNNSEKNLILFFDSDSCNVLNFVKEAKLKYGSDNICFAKIF